MTRRSLRRSFLYLWLSWLAATVALGGLMAAGYERSSAVQLRDGRLAVERACRAAGERYRLLAASGTGAETTAARDRDLAVVMQAALYQFPGVEGSLWRAAGGFFGYAYPTYEGPAKHDVPPAER